MNNKLGKIRRFGFAGVTAALLLGSVAASSAQDCAAGDRKLATTGLCASDARALMPPVDQDFVYGLEVFECKAVVNDAPMFSDAFLYYGADCGQGPVQLELGAGAHSGSISVLGAGAHEPGTKMFQLGTILTSDPAKPTASLERWASYDEQGYSPKCKARRIQGTRDQWVVDEYTNDNLPAGPQDGPRSACGTYGYTQESDAQWRVAHGYSWWADFGQDAYKDFDFSSFTVVTKENGRWVPLGGTPIAATPAPRVVAPAAPSPAASSGGHVKNIAGAQEAAYGETRGWTVYTGKRNGAFEYCVGERDYSGTKLRIGSDGRQWQFAVPYPVSANYTGQFEVDGVTWDMRGTSDGQWAYAWVGPKELDAIRNGNLMILDIARASLDFELIGTAAVLLKIQECVDRSR